MESNAPLVPRFSRSVEGDGRFCSMAELQGLLRVSQRLHLLAELQSMPRVSKHLRLLAGVQALPQALL